MVTPQNPTRSAVLPTILLVLGFGITAMFLTHCGRSPDRFLVTQRAITDAFVEVTTTSPPQDSGPDTNPLRLRAKITSHISAMTAGPAELTLETPDPNQSNATTRLRYLLPGGFRIPINSGDTVNLDVFRSPTSPHTDPPSVVLYDDQGQVILAWRNNTDLPPESITHLLVIERSWKVSYQESGRDDGFCESWVDHGVARVDLQVGLEQPQTAELTPGQSIEFSSPFGTYVLWLLEFATTKRTTCPVQKADRFAYVLARISHKFSSESAESPADSGVCGCFLPGGMAEPCRGQKTRTTPEDARESAVVTQDL